MRPLAIIRSNKGSCAYKNGEIRAIKAHSRSILWLHQPLPEQIFDIAATLAGLLSVLPNFTRALTFRTEKMQAAAQTGYLNAMAAATYLSNKGVPFRKAHEIVANAVRLGLSKNEQSSGEVALELNQLPLADLQTLSPEFATDFFDSITIESTLNCHDVPGGTATHRVAKALTAAKHRIAALASPAKGDADV